MRKILPVAVVLAGCAAVLTAAAPAQASATITCLPASAGTDSLMAFGGASAGFVVTHVVYRFPNGRTLSVRRDTDAMMAAYAADRGTAVSVCGVVGTRRI